MFCVSYNFKNLIFGAKMKYQVGDKVLILHSNEEGELLKLSMIKC